MKHITPCIWFDSGAEDAAKFYTSIFPNSKILGQDDYTTETPSNKPIGSVLTVTISLDGNEFMLLNGGPTFKVSEAISFIIPCKDQAEIDYYYEKLSAVPDAEVCGWLKDKYGLSWQLIPEDYETLMNQASSEAQKAAMDALLKMKRIDANELEKILKS